MRTAPGADISELHYLSTSSLTPEAAPTQIQPEGTPGYFALPSPIPLPPFEEGIDKDNLLSLSKSCRVAQSAAENAREKKLRDDPMAIVIGPLYVDCRRCGKRIKLSSKSLYDNSHWRTHRSRCLKGQSSKPKKVRLKANPAAPLDLPGTPSRPPTPPLIKGDPAEMPISSPPPEGREQHLPYDPITPPQSRPTDTAFEDYLLRSNRRKHLTVFKASAKWQDWSWSQLLLPQFQLVQRTDIHSYDSGGDSTTQVDLYNEYFTIPFLSRSF